MDLISCHISNLVNSVKNVLVIVKKEDLFPVLS